MKILRLRFQNLNSLRGASEIDFETGPLGAAGLFAITGPTGAGKSTLLDAMTLALYGKAARYGSQPSPETMMSRHTGECFAELEFSCAGGRFRSSWHLQRAHRKPGGKLQNPKRRVIAVPGETVLSEKNDESGRLIEQLTGLDYERFLRSVMLAQGDFAAFLKAKPDDRANLLEQVTGTSLYRDISVQSFQRFTQAKAAHELLLGQSANIQVLDTAERERRQAELARLTAEISQHRQVRGALQARIQTAQGRLAWAQAEKRRLESLQVHEQECLLHQPELSRLDLGEKARSFVPSLAGLDRELTQLRVFASQIDSITALIPGLSSSLSAAELAVAKSSHALEQERLEQERLQALWLCVQQLDTQLETALTSCQPLEQQLVSLEAEAQERSGQLAIQTRELAEVEAVLVKGREWLSANAGDAALADLEAPARLASQAWAEALRRLHEASRRIQSLNTESASQGRAVEAAEAALRQVHAQLLQPRQDDLAAKAALDTILPEGGLAQLEQAVVQARTRREQAVALLEQARRLHDFQSQLAVLLLESKEAAELLAALEQEILQARGKRELLEKLRQACRQTLVFAERCAALVQERPLLQDGRECPLCGATHHPWAHRKDEDSEDLQKAREAEADAERSLSLQDSQLVSLQTQFAGAKERDAQLRRATDKLQKELLSAQSSSLHLLTALGLSSDLPELAYCETLSASSFTLEQEAETRLHKARKASDRHLACSLDLRRLEALHDAAAASLASQQALHAQLSAQLAQHAAAQQEAEADVLARAASARQLLQPFGFPSDGDQTAHLQTIEKLSKRARVYASSTQKLQDFLQKQLVLDLSLKALQEQVARLLLSRQGLQASLDTEREKLSSLRRSRMELFGEQAIDISRQEARARLLGITKVNTDAEAAQRDLQARLLTAQKDLTRLREQQQSTDQGLVQLTAALEASAALAGFASLPSLRAAVLSGTDYEQLSSLQRRLSERRAALNSEAARLEHELSLFPPNALEDSTQLESLAAEQQTLEAAASQLSKLMGAHEECIRIDDTNRARLGSLLAETEAAHREFARWDALRSLIGSADGSLFARFAQGLTLDRLAWLANTHLIQLNPRYSVRRSRGPEAKDLELEIMDHFQADVVRPMGSLSGGESFLVSLALALALSELASGKSAIESLFIDEGFGSLDADTLEAAMAALEGLQSRGKTIGVISHVAVMQERIATQIRVIKESGGCSRILVVG